MIVLSRFIIGIAEALIALGGCYDLFTSKLPPSLAAVCADRPQAVHLTRELLRTLGAVGAAILWIMLHAHGRFSRFDLILLLLLGVPSEGMNAFAMRRVGSPWQFPAAFLAILLAGIMMSILA
jgi:hypothetical protein